MGAYNYIFFDAVCPSCRRRTRLRAQTHVVSSFAGDERGRFCNRDYELGETMVWWARDDADWNSWIEGADQHSEDGSVATEDCNADCTECEADLLVTMEFREAVPVVARNIRTYLR